MSFDLQAIETIVVLMLENRSFDHLLGRLAASADGVPVVDGLRGVIGPDRRLLNNAYANPLGGTPYYPFHSDGGPHATDLPHDWQSVATQLAASRIDGRPSMLGFVEAYAKVPGASRTRYPDPMGFVTEAEAPVSHFLARRFLVCDRWFAPFPSDTQANRLTALCGFTTLREARWDALLPDQYTMLDWLEDHGVPWRVYRNGLSFLTLMPRWIGPVARGERFVDVAGGRLEQDFATEPAGSFPKVVLVEPAYYDVPDVLKLGDPPNDNHAPLGLAPGEAYLKRVYEAVTANRERWAKTVLIVTYDEHGGFYDHVAPPAVRSAVGVVVTTMGVRVPAMVISPFVEPGRVFSGLLDHTSILQLLAERFAPGAAGYSDAVSYRRQQGVGSVSAVFDRPQGGSEVPEAPAPPPPVSTPAGVATRRSANQRAFLRAAGRLREEPGAAGTHPGLAAWDGQEPT
jgi:phospholipase C